MTSPPPPATNLTADKFASFFTYKVAAISSEFTEPLRHNPFPLVKILTEPPKWSSPTCPSQCPLAQGTIKTPHAEVLLHYPVLCHPRLRTQQTLWLLQRPPNGPSGLGGDRAWPVWVIVQAITIMMVIWCCKGWQSFRHDESNVWS